MKKFEIRGIYTYAEAPVRCHGEIGFIRFDHDRGTVYASWNMISEEGQELGGVSRDYFVGENISKDEAVLERILMHIENYRIGRRRAYKHIELVYDGR